MATKFGLFLQKFQIASSFLYFDGIEPFFGRQFSVNPSTKRCSSIFGLGPQTPKTDSPKFDQKSPITRLVWQIDQRCLRLIGGFRGWPIEWNHTKCSRADPCCHGNEIWAKIAYKSTCTTDRPQMFWPSRGFSGTADSMQKYKICTADPCCHGNDICARRGV